VDDGHSAPNSLLWCFTETRALQPTRQQMNVDTCTINYLRYFCKDSDLLGCDTVPLLGFLLQQIVLSRTRTDRLQMGDISIIFVWIDTLLSGRGHQRFRGTHCHVPPRSKQLPTRPHGVTTNDHKPKRHYSSIYLLRLSLADQRHTRRRNIAHVSLGHATSLIV
jgi:hypothetical protein